RPARAVRRQPLREERAEAQRRTGGRPGLHRLDRRGVGRRKTEHAPALRLRTPPPPSTGPLPRPSTPGRRRAAARRSEASPRGPVPSTTLKSPPYRRRPTIRIRAGPDRAAAGLRLSRADARSVARARSRYFGRACVRAASGTMPAGGGRPYPRTLP